MRKKERATVAQAEYVSRYAAYRKERHSEQKPENSKATALRFFALIKPHWVLMTVVVLSAMANTVCDVASPRFMGNVINEIQLLLENRIQTGEKLSFEGIYSSITVLAVIYIASALFSFLQEFFSAGLSQKLVCMLRERLNGKLSRLPLKYFDSQTKGEVISKVVNDIENVSSSLQSSILTIITSVIKVIGSLVMMLSTRNYYMTFAAVALVPVSAGLSYWVSKKSRIWVRRYWDSMGDLHGHIEEMFAGHTLVRMFGHEQQSVREFREITGRLGKNSFTANMISGVLNPVLTLIKNINYTALCLLGGYLYIGVREGTVSIRFGGLGDITAFLTYSGYFSSPIINLSRIINSIQSSLASAERVFSVLDEEEQTPDRYDGELPTPTRGQVEFRDVTFSYSPDRKLIEHLDLTAAPGSVTAIVGPTGAGKTTIVNLLMRFYDIRDGQILLDGTDIYSIPRDDLRKNFGMVLQDTWLFKGTIRENIRYGRETATDEEIEAAAKTAGIYDYIVSQPKGFDTELTEDATNLSQGQRQLITIARALVANPEILILDEATSSVDTKTEQQIQAAMETLMQGRTCFVIAHRLSTIKNADTILVMKKGAIVEQGTHQSLLDADGYYALLYNSQFTDGIPPED